MLFISLKAIYSLVIYLKLFEPYLFMFLINQTISNKTIGTK